MVCWLGSGVFGGVIFPERYRSGHNGTDSKSVGGFAAPRGFESLPLRQIKELRILFSLNKPVKRLLTDTLTDTFIALALLGAILAKSVLLMQHP